MVMFNSYVNLPEGIALAKKKDFANKRKELTS